MYTRRAGMYNGRRENKCSVIGRLLSVNISMQGKNDFVHGGKGLAALSLWLNIFLTCIKISPLSFYRS